jgi:hypothetical protein
MDGPSINTGKHIVSGISLCLYQSPRERLLDKHMEGLSTLCLSSGHEAVQKWT